VAVLIVVVGLLVCLAGKLALDAWWRHWRWPELDEPIETYPSVGVVDEIQAWLEGS